ncbi:hypothetical protein MPSEU_000253700 [Mayamaea pseudoterrestris]|nr:hypothetical protein MPSEU_000253700 [Mayamaea pseudoterrestris]
MIQSPFIILLSALFVCTYSFTSQPCFASRTRQLQIPNYSHASFTRSMSEQKQQEGIIELDDEVESTPDTKTDAATPGAVPFLSQGEILPESLNPDLSDPKQARVIIYIILSLLPVLFLIPFMLGSRDLIPLEDLPPVQM